MELGAWVEEEIVPPLLERDVQGVVVGVYSEIGHHRLNNKENSTKFMYNYRSHRLGKKEIISSKMYNSIKFKLNHYNDVK